jgi:diguanylate cyclase (GGDEF)-like protein
MINVDLHDAVLRDALTGVYTRAVFEGRLGEEVASAARFEHPLSLLVLDIDHFKSVNDGFGHARGDCVLAEFGIRLKREIRAHDSVYRYGGDEFVVLLPNTPMEKAVDVAQRLLKAVSASLFPGDPPINLSISVGVAAFPQDGTGPDDLFFVADRRLYQAKRRGRAQIVHQDNARTDFSATQQQSQLIERDQAIETIQGFLNQVVHQARSALCLSGPPGCGLTRLLADAERAAQMSNMATLSIQGTPALGKRQFGALLDARHRLGDLPNPALGPQPYAAALQQACRQALIPGQPYQALAILIDDPAYLDKPSLEFLLRLYFAEQLPPLALVYTHSGGLPIPLLGALEPQRTITASPLSRDGIQLWLRFYLQWEATPEFIDWLHEQTGGVPTQIQRGLDTLIQTHVLQRIGENWRCQTSYERIPLAEFLTCPSNPPCRLPIGPGPFIGRQTELHALKQSLRQERWISLVGPGGLGKTRLAVQLAGESLAFFPQGVFFVPLAGLQSAAQLLPAIAEALQFQFIGSKGPRQELFDFLQSRRVLLVMDNFEHLREGADLLLEILAQAPGVSLLVTSRDALNLPEEWLFDLDGLAYPLSENEAEIETYEAVRLFQQAAHPGLSGSALPEGERRSVARICRLVEGSPLGLELAAAWAHVIPPHQIAAEIERSLAFLASEAPERLPRHRSLRAVLDSTWDLLTGTEQDLVCALAVFANGFQREAARAVVDVSALFLDVLVAKAYLRVDPQARYQMHELLRQYAAGKLALKPALDENARERHSGYYLEWVGSCTGCLEDDPQTIGMVSRDLDNIRQAWTWAQAHDRIDLLRRASNGLQVYLDCASRWEEGRQMLAPTIQWLEDRPGFPADEVFWLELKQAQGSFLKPLGRLEEARAILEEVRARWIQLGQAAGLCQTLLELGDVYWFLGSLSQARGLLEESLRLARELDDRPRIIDALILLANIAIDQADLPAALAMLTESLAISRAIGSRAKTANTLKLLGIAYSEYGDTAAAQASSLESLAIYREIGARLGIAEILNNLGTDAINSGQMEEAQSRLEESLFLTREIGHRYMETVCLNNLGILANERGEVLSAQTYFEDAQRLYQASGYKRGVIDTLDSLAVVAIKQKEYATARERYRECLGLATQIGYKRLIPYNLVGLACLAWADEHLPQRAVQLCAAAQSFQNRYHYAVDQVQQRLQEQTLGNARVVLSPADFEAAWTAGQALTDEQALALALDEGSGGGAGQKPG